MPTFFVDSAEDGGAALGLWEDGEYHLLLIDLLMPVMDGIEATRNIRDIGRKRGGPVPIVGISASKLSTNKERCLAAGIDAYLHKPFKLSEFLEIIEDVCCATRPSHRHDVARVSRLAPLRGRPPETGS